VNEIVRQNFEAKPAPHIVPPTLEAGLDSGIPGEPVVVGRVARPVSWVHTPALPAEAALPHTSFEVVSELLLFLEGAVHGRNLYGHVVTIRHL